MYTSFYFPKCTSDYSFSGVLSVESHETSLSHIYCELLVSKRSTILYTGNFVSDNSTGDNLSPVRDTGNEKLATKPACLYLTVNIK
jgi:hypothetical protein